jgi:predicted ATP-dependent endonuclease of OLD family
MKLLDMTVKNFRSICGSKTKISFQDSDIIFVFGKNNAGKSAMLSAYEYLVTPKQTATINDFCGFTEENSIEITATFLKEDGDDQEFEKKGFNKWVDENGIIKFRKKWLKANTEGQKETWDVEEEKFVDNGFGGIETHFKKQAPTPIRISAMSSPDELSKWVTDVMKKSILKTLKDDEQEAYQKVVDEIKALQDRILSKDDITKLSRKANVNFQKVFPELELEVSTEIGATIDISKTLEKEFSVTIKDSRYEGVNQKVSDHGHGVIRQTMFNILGLVKQEVPVGAIENTNKKLFLILYEEPEIYLHPKAIILLRKALYDLCVDSPFQILCVSHSPHLIDISKPHTSLVRMIKNCHGSTSVFQVGHDLFASTEDKKQQVQMINRFNPHICESFFADDIVIVEGDTEAIVVRELLANYAPEKDIFVLNSGSKNNIPFFQQIFTHFNIKHQVIHDADSKYLYDQDGCIIKNKDGEKRKNSAWELNKTIWDGVKTAHSMDGILAQRYVSIPNFESVHNYKYDPEKGKPLSAYEFVKNLEDDKEVMIQKFVRCIIGTSEIDTDFSQEELEKLIIN